MAKIKNISDGPRGAWLGTELIMADPGKVIEADDFCKEWFAPVKGETAGTDEPGPLDQSVADLEGHLATLTDADEVEALLDAEIAGKSRKGAIAALEARRDELLA